LFFSGLDDPPVNLENVGGETNQEDIEKLAEVDDDMNLVNKFSKIIFSLYTLTLKFNTFDFKIVESSASLLIFL